MKLLICHMAIILIFADICYIAYYYSIYAVITAVVGDISRDFVKIIIYGIVFLDMQSVDML